jgi:IS5 family transposase
MPVREPGQISFADALAFRRAGVNERLDRIAGLIDWEAVAKILASLRRARRGAPGYAPLVLFKAVLLAQWNDLSDEAMEEMLADRLSFQRFCGLDLSAAKPDHTTLWRFREALAGSGLADCLFAEINRQLEGRGLILKRGTLIDATLVAAQAVAPPPPPVEPGRAPGEEAPSRLVRSTIDPDAGWTRRGARRFFGYKGHVAVDLGSGLIRGQIFTSAEINETTVADRLIQGDEAAVYADKAYDAQARSALLKELRIKNRIQKRGNKHHDLSARDTLRNRLIGHIRGRVETVFAYLKRICGYRRVRYFCEPRNAAQFALLCTAYNLNRAAILAS